VHVLDIYIYIFFVSICCRCIHDCWHILKCVFLAYIMVVVEANFYAGVGLGIGADFNFIWNISHVAFVDFVSSALVNMSPYFF
jgi:hypothetical protein